MLEDTVYLMVITYMYYMYNVYRTNQSFQHKISSVSTISHHDLGEVRTCVPVKLKNVDIIH